MMALKDRRAFKLFVRGALVGSAVVAGVATALPGVASAWTRWTDIDPVVDLNGAASGGTINIHILWPSEYDCAVNSPIEVKLGLPAQYNNAVLISESGDTVCGNTMVTETKLNTKGKQSDEITVAVKLRADKGDTFPVKVVVISGEEQTTLVGDSKKGIRGSVEP